MKFFVCTAFLVAAACAAPSETRDKRGIFGEPGGLLTPHLHADLHHDLHHDLYPSLHHDLHHDLHHGLHYDTHLHAPLYSSAPLLSYSPLLSHSHVHSTPILTDHYDHAHLHTAPVLHELAPLHSHVYPPTTIIKRVKHIKLGGW